MAYAQNTSKACRLRRVRYSKDERDARAACLSKPFMIPPKGDTCPIYNLPPELLSRIFEFGGSDSHVICQVDEQVLYDMVEISFEQRRASDKGTTVDVANRSSDKRAAEHIEWDFDPSYPFRICVSLVSRYWRSVAISTPSLWTAITIPNLPDAYPPSCAFLSLLLQRSNSLPIGIHLRGCFQVDTYPLFTPYMDRWHSIKVEFPSDESTESFLHAVSHPSVPAAPRLTALQLYRKEAGPHSAKSLTLFGGSAPRLERLTLWGVHVDWNQAWISSAVNLTYLELAFHIKSIRPSWVQFATILRGAPSLKTLKLYASGPSESVHWPYVGSLAEESNPPIQLLQLTDFCVGLRTQVDIARLFRKLYMPSLTSLAFQFRARSCDDLVTYLVGPPTSLAPPSHHETTCSLLNKLEKLKIISFPCSRGGIETFFGELQNLETLSIALNHLRILSPFFLETLVFPCELPGRSVWLPLLETLYVSQISNNFQLIRLVIQKRKRLGVPLKSLYLEHSCGIDFENFTWFKENVETLSFFEEADQALIDLPL